MHNQTDCCLSCLRDKDVFLPAYSQLPAQLPASICWFEGFPTPTANGLPAARPPGPRGPAFGARPLGPPAMGAPPMGAPPGGFTQQSQQPPGAGFAPPQQSIGRPGFAPPGMYCPEAQYRAHSTWLLSSIHRCCEHNASKFASACNTKLPKQPRL